MKSVTVRYALTREDCVNGALARLSMLFPKKTYSIFRAAGFLLFCSGCVLFALSVLQENRLAWPGAVLAVTGVFAAFFLHPTQEASVRRMARDGFDSGKFGTPAQTVTFGPEYFELRSERYEAKIPYRMLASAYENAETFLIFTEAEEWRAVPKRTMNSEECASAEKFLREGMKEKFRQEVS